MSDPPSSTPPPYFGAPGFAESYWVELLLGGPPQLDVDALVGRLKTRMQVEVMASAITDQAGTVSLGYTDRLIDVEADGKTIQLPVMTNLVWSNARINLGDYKPALDQTWEWDGAKKALGRCWNKMLVGDITGSRLPYRERLERLTEVVVACAELTKAEVCFWKEAACLVEPARLAERLARVCNVRLFEVGIRGDHLMDTLGLAAIGLPDLQLEFRKLEPSWVGGWLYGVARNLFEQGNVIADGDVVPAPVAGEHWKCHLDVAKIAPARTVINITPDAPNDSSSATGAR